MSTFRPAFSVLALAIGALVSGNVSAQIYSNGPLSTGATTESGVAAPAGTTWSELQHDIGVTTVSNTTLGSAGYAGSFRLADDFVVPAGPSWTISAIETFAYKTGSAATPSPFVAATLRIWNGRPGDVGSTILCGDTTTNVLNTSTDALIFRTGGTVVPAPATPGTTRKVWRNRLNVPVACAGSNFFAPGTYWIDYDTADSAAGTHFYPLVTVPGSRTPPGTPNARQFTVAGATWADVADVGNPAGVGATIPQSLPFLLFGTLPVSLQSFSVD